jgi:hypothetical protein
MMGYLSAHSKTTKVVLENPDGDYWVELKNCLNSGDKEEAESALTSGDFTPGEEVKMRMDIARYRQHMVLASIVKWNLDDEAGNVWPIDLDHVRLIPGPDFDHLWESVDQLNAPAPAEERRRFPARGVRGDKDGNTGTAKSR